VTLYQVYRPRVLRLCVSRLGNLDEAEDVAEEVFVRVLKHLSRFGGELNFAAWVLTIASNLCRDVIRRRRRLAMRSVDLESVPCCSTEEEGEEAVSRASKVAVLSEAFRRLNSRHQRILRLREVEQLSYEEIARREGLRLPAVEAVIFRARQALKREYMALVATGRRMLSIAGTGFVGLRAMLARRIGHLRRPRGIGVFVAVPKRIFQSPLGQWLSEDPGPKLAAAISLAAVALGIAGAQAPNAVPHLGRAPIVRPQGDSASAGVPTAGTTQLTAARGTPPPSSSPSAGSPSSSVAHASGQQSQSGSVPGSASGLIPQTATGLTNAVSGLASGVTGELSSGVQGFGTTAGSTVSAVGSAASALTNGVGSALGTLVGALLPTGGSAISSAVVGVASATGQGVAGTTSAIGNAVTSASQAASSLLSSAGSSLSAILSPAP
jgi:RNA polymerase sigma-70 factor (ECF subfamily)